MQSYLSSCSKVLMCFLKHITHKLFQVSYGRSKRVSVISCYSQHVRDRVNVISELLSVKSRCMELSITSDVDMDLSTHQSHVL